ncbi:MAG: ABC transporter substrate-binding protein [Chloroflexota bacterium]
MTRFKKFAKRAAKIIALVLLLLVLLAGSLFIWIRSEPREVTECEAGFRLIENASGADCVPENASKILLNSTSVNQFFIAVDQPSAMMVGVLDYFTAADIPGLYSRLREVNEGVIDLGTVQGGAAQNLELLLEVDPDVIITEFDLGDLVKPAETIAPVIILTHLDTWKEMTLFAGDLIGEQAEAERLLAEYDARVEILRAQFDDPSEITISNVRIFQDLARVQLPASFSGQIIRDVGFSFPEEQLALIEETPDLYEIRVSDERIDLIDADYLFLYGGLPDWTFETNLETTSSSVVDTFRSDPLFQFLDAEDANTVHEVDIYWAATGIYSAHAVLDDLFRHVAGVDPEEVAPNPLRLE